MSRRIRSNGGYVWDTPVPLSSLNTSGIDAAPNYFTNERGRPQLFFTTTRLGGPEDIHMSELRKDGVWGDPVPVFELDSPAPDGRSAIRRDGLEIIFDSTATGQATVRTTRRCVTSGGDGGAPSTRGMIRRTSAAGIETVVEMTADVWACRLKARSSTPTRSARRSRAALEWTTGGSQPADRTGRRSGGNDAGYDAAVRPAPDQ